MVNSSVWNNLMRGRCHLAESLTKVPFIQFSLPSNLHGNDLDSLYHNRCLIVAVVSTFCWNMGTWTYILFVGMINIDITVVFLCHLAPQGFCNLGSYKFESTWKLLRFFKNRYIKCHVLLPTSFCLWTVIWQVSFVIFQFRATTSQKPTLQLKGH